MAKQIIELDVKVETLGSRGALADLKNKPKKDQRGDGAADISVELEPSNLSIFKSQYDHLREEMDKRVANLNSKIAELEEGNVVLASKIGDTEQK